MRDHSGAFVAFDVAKTKHAVAGAESGRAGEIRFVGEIENAPATIAQTIKKEIGSSPWPAARLLRGRSDWLRRPHADMVGGPTFAGPGVGAGSASQSSSQQTLCWREMDSNFKFRAK